MLRHQDLPLAVDLRCRTAYFGWQRNIEPLRDNRMSSFDDRKRAEEARFAHDAELRFKAEARRNKHLAHWASAQMGVSDADAIANYVAEIIAADMAEGGHADVVRKVKADLDAKGVAIEEAAIEARIAEFDAQAREEILSES